MPSTMPNARRWRPGARRALFTLALAATAGCASSSGEGWTKPGMTQEQLDRDTLSCIQRAQITVPGRDGPRMKVDQPRYRECMAAQGYSTGPSR
jgi:hypothetical protein